MDNVQLSKAVIERVLQDMGRTAYEKMEKSPYEGFIYEVRDSENERTFNVDIRFKEPEAFMFAVFPGIHICDRAFLPAVTLYCQQIVTEFGFVGVNADHLNIEYRVESVIKENPVCQETLEIYEHEALRILNLHYENLINLASGRVLAIKPVDNQDLKSSGLSKPMSETAYESSVQSIRDYLCEKAGHNAVCEKIGPQGADFYSHILTGKESYHMKFCVSRYGILTVITEYGEKALVVPEAYQYAVSEYINEKNSRHIFTCLSMGNKDNGVHYRMSTSLLDGIAGEETLEVMESISVNALSECIAEIEQLAAGIMPGEQKETVRDKLSFLPHFLPTRTRAGR